MKILAYFCLVILSINFAWSQQQPTYTQYTFNRFALNPAVAGIKPCADTKFGNRRQWVGFEGAPVTYFVSHTNRWNRKDKYPDELHGIGLILSQERLGFTERTSFKAAYAYHLKLWKNYRLSFGMHLGMQRFSQAYSEINMPQKGFDPALDNEVEATTIFPEISPGSFIYNKNFYVGLSSIQIFPTRVKEMGTRENRLSVHYFLMGGYRLRGRNLDYTPSFLLSFAPFASPTLDLSLTIDYDQKIALGFGSKYLNSGYALLKFSIAKTLSIGYSYEYALNEIANTFPSSHEIIISISTCGVEEKQPKFYCPAYQ